MQKLASSIYSSDNRLSGDLKVDLSQSQLADHAFDTQRRQLLQLIDDANTELDGKNPILHDDMEKRQPVRHKLSDMKLSFIMDKKPAISMKKDFRSLTQQLNLIGDNHLTDVMNTTRD